MDFLSNSIFIYTIQKITVTKLSISSQRIKIRTLFVEKVEQF